MIDASSNGVTYKLMFDGKPAIDELNKTEARMQQTLERSVAKLSQKQRVALGVDFNEAAVRKRMADLIRDMQDQAKSAQIEMEARVRLFGPDGRTPLDQWAKQSAAFAGKSTWSGGKQGAIEAVVGQGGSGGSTWSGSGGGGGGSPGLLGGLKDIFGKGSQLSQVTKLLHGGGAIIGLSMALDSLGRMLGGIRNIRDEIRLAGNDAGDLNLQFAKSIPVLGKIVTIATELDELLSSQNFNQARSAEVVNAVQSATQQVFLLQRDVNKTVESIGRENASVQNEIDVLNASPEDRGRAKFNVDAKQRLTDYKNETKKMLDEVGKQYEGILNAPLSGELPRGAVVSSDVQSQMRNVSLIKLETEAINKSRKAQDELLKAQSRVVAGNKLGGASDVDIKKMQDAAKVASDAAEAQKNISDAITSIRSVASGIQTTISSERDAGLNNLKSLEDAQRNELSRLDTFNASQLQKEIEIANLRGSGHQQESERAALVKRLADQERDAAEVGEESLKKQKDLSTSILADFDKRVALAREEAAIAEGVRIKIAQQRLSGDIAGAIKTEHDARNAAEIREKQRSGAGVFGVIGLMARQQIEDSALLADKQFQSELALSRSQTDVQQARLRASQRYYDAEVYAIEQAYQEQIRIAERSENKLAAIQVAEDQRRARMIELDAQTEQRARDAGFEANQIRLHREGKDAEAQRAAIMKQAQDEMKQVGDNASARSAIIERTKQQLLELQDADAGRRGTGAWLADAIYSLAPNAPRNNTLNATNSQALASLGGSPSGGGLLSSLVKTGKMMALFPEEAAAMRAAQSGGLLSNAMNAMKTDADSKVEIRGEVVTLLRDIKKNTESNTAVFS